MFNVGTHYLAGEFRPKSIVYLFNTVKGEKFVIDDIGAFANAFFEKILVFY